ncbi:MAG: hypothetical protein C4346_09945 [Chloroflexota bacterium]
MTTLLHRCCATCRFHREGESACTGVCEHPCRQPRAGVTPFVRDRELPCRRGWGDDLWEPRSDEPPVTRLVIWGPFTGDDLVFDDLPVDLLRYLLHTQDD